MTNPKRQPALPPVSGSTANYELVAQRGKFYIMDYARPLVKQVVAKHNNLFDAEKHLEMLQAPAKL